MEFNPLGILMTFGVIIALGILLLLVLMIILYSFRIIRIEKKSWFFNWGIGVGVIASIIFLVVT